MGMRSPASLWGRSEHLVPPMSAGISTAQSAFTGAELLTPPNCSEDMFSVLTTPVKLTNWFSAPNFAYKLCPERHSQRVCERQWRRRRPLRS